MLPEAAGGVIVQGQCQCGGVAFTAEAPFDAPCACHCTQCRTWSGHFWASVGVPHARFSLTRSETLRWFRTSAKARRGFCQCCGASLFWQPEGEARIAFAMGALEAPTGFRLAEHIFTSSAGDYYSETKSDSCAPEVLSVSCLCGGCHFTIPGPAGDITGCHCTQCRKLSGHYSASFDVAEQSLAWISDATLGHYSTEGGGQRGFCTGCGTSLWFRAFDGALSVEAGAVDGPAGGRLRQHIYVANKGDYYDLTDGLPRHWTE